MKITSSLGCSNLSFKIDGAIKTFHDKQKLKWYMTTNTTTEDSTRTSACKKMKAN
jgi:hypothetical protein